MHLFARTYYIRVLWLLDHWCIKYYDVWNRVCVHILYKLGYYINISNNFANGKRDAFFFGHWNNCDINRLTFYVLLFCRIIRKQKERKKKIWPRPQMVPDWAPQIIYEWENLSGENVTSALHHSGATGRADKQKSLLNTSTTNKQ